MKKEVKVFINTRFYRIISVDWKDKFFFLAVTEPISEILNPPPEDLMRQKSRMKQFVEKIKDDEKIGYFAEFFSNEIIFDDRGNVYYHPEEIGVKT